MLFYFERLQRRNGELKFNIILQHTIYCQGEILLNQIPWKNQIGSTNTISNEKFVWLSISKKLNDILRGFWAPLSWFQGIFVSNFFSATATPRNCYRPALQIGALLISFQGLIKLMEMTNNSDLLYHSQPHIVGKNLKKVPRKAMTKVFWNFCELSSLEEVRPVERTKRCTYEKAPIWKWFIQIRLSIKSNIIWHIPKSTNEIKHFLKIHFNLKY